jgi:cysteine-rich repeat protein
VCPSFSVQAIDELVKDGTERPMISKSCLELVPLLLLVACVPNSGRFDPRASGGRAGTGGAVAVGGEAGAGEGGAAGGDTTAGGSAGTGAATGSGRCGDGTVEGAERCDDGNPKPGDGCTADCLVETGWRCEDSQPSVCDEICGDGRVVGVEATAGGCDDGNTAGGDGCKGSCRVEDGFFCSRAPSVCVNTCGNGALDGDEACDDANGDSGDGCNACAEEPDFRCTDEPSVCTRVNDCEPEPCDNGGVCVDGVNSFSCECSGTGFTGPTCTDDTDDCNPDPCENGGACIEVGGDYLCQCDGTGFEGTRCQTNVDDCSPDPCLHGGVCSDLVNGYACDCTGTGYYGTTCELDASDCSPDPCQNGGVCMEDSGTVTCDCTGTGYDGSSCQNEIDDCSPNPCLHGGSCADGVNDFTCDCSLTGFVGDTCETNVNDCSPNPCQNGGLCSDGINTYTCTCEGTGFTGANCEIGAEWIRQFGTSVDDQGYGVSVDPSGNVLVAGYTTGALPGQSSGGGEDAFVAKYSSSGTLQWVRQLGTSGTDRAVDLVVDSNGNPYVAGNTDGTFPGQTTGGDAFVARFDDSGTLQWTSQLGVNGFAGVQGMGVDSAGNAYVAGHTNGTFSGQSSAGDFDVFIGKFDASGTFQWVRQVGTTVGDYVLEAAADSVGNAYIVGYTTGAFSGSEGGNDAFVMKYNSSGVLQWVRQLGTSATDYGRGVGTDSNGNVYVTGNTIGTFSGQSSAGVSDTFLAKYSSSGALQWTRQFGTSQGDSGLAVSVDASGNAHVTGYTLGAFPSYSNAGLYDVFAAKYNSSGTLQWTRQFGTTGYDAGNRVHVDANGVVCIAGYTDGAFSGQTNAGAMDAYVAKLVP